MKITCDEATAICDKNQYKEASLWEKIKLGMHIFFCRKCGKYSRQNTIMTKCYEIHKCSENAEKLGLCDEEKKEWEEKLKAKI
ncbi:MAG: hypothetical protein CVU01_04000 [Bacteroidetes bacterium HGW-Bacteroidetes-18]|nr:MAG: hypothetical protein CVU01_04000 [Bacteroidetes bacterium HGW-Bacteroidetes-18]